MKSNIDITTKLFKTMNTIIAGEEEKETGITVKIRVYISALNAFENIEERPKILKDEADVGGVLFTQKLLWWTETLMNDFFSNLSSEEELLNINFTKDDISFIVDDKYFLIIEINTTLFTENSTDRKTLDVIVTFIRIFIYDNHNFTNCFLINSNPNMSTCEVYQQNGKKRVDESIVTAFQEGLENWVIVEEKEEEEDWVLVSSIFNKEQDLEMTYSLPQNYATYTEILQNPDKVGEDFTKPQNPGVITKKENSAVVVEEEEDSGIIVEDKDLGVVVKEKDPDFFRRTNPGILESPNFDNDINRKGYINRLIPSSSFFDYPTIPICFKGQYGKQKEKTKDVTIHIEEEEEEEDVDNEIIDLTYLRNENGVVNIITKIKKYAKCSKETAEEIYVVMKYGDCTIGKAVKELKESRNDYTNAILNLNLNRRILTTDVDVDVD